MSVLHLLTFFILHGGTVEAGIAPRYRQGVMEQVAANRGLPTAPYMCSRIENEIGSWIVVYGQKTGKAVACNVVDVSDPAHVARHRRRGFVAELSHEVAAIVCGSTRSRPADCPVMVWKL